MRVLTHSVNEFRRQFCGDLQELFIKNEATGAHVEEDRLRIRNSLDFYAETSVNVAIHIKFQSAGGVLHAWNPTRP